MLPAFRTVSEAIARVGAYYPDHDFVFQDHDGTETAYDFVALEAETARRAAGLQALGLAKGDRIGLVVVEPEDFVLTFLGALRVGVVPVPMYPPVSFGNLDAYVARTAKVLDSAQAALCVVSAKVAAALGDRLGTRLVVASTLTSDATPAYPAIEPADLAFLQYTSGSTSDPKGVMVTHASLVANSQGIIHEGLQLRAEDNDKGVSWLPLYHDMGLIGFVIAPLLHAISVVFIPTLRFVKRPSVWMDTVHRHRGTASFAPNFAYLLATKRVRPDELATWDLSCLRVLGCGAEPINPHAMRAFTETFAPCGLPATAIMPAYGMAEATLAIALKPAPERFTTLLADALAFQETGEVVPPGDGAVIELVACGVPFRGHEVGAFDERGDRLEDGREGELWFRGPSVTAGYFRNPEATAAAFRADGWLRTGDLGVVRDGQVYVTGRIKDLIIVNGRNVHPQAVEWAVGTVDGVRHGNAVAFSVPGDAGERLIVAVETKDADHARLGAAVRAVVQAELGLSIADVACLRSGALPKTSSGKLQRRKTRELYLAGVLAAPRAVAGDATIVC
jgi:fatty-acyl-CoA synthase